MRAVITVDECDMPYGVIPNAQNEFPLACGRVRYIGGPIAAVAAIDEAKAAAASPRCWPNGCCGGFGTRPPDQLSNWRA